jgi:small multidrug resistance pump
VNKWLCLSGAIITEVSATLALKAALDAPWWYSLVIFGYLAAFGLLTVCLRLGMGISVAYGIWGASGVTLTALMSALVFDEALTNLMVLGMILILAGVICVERGSHQASRQEIKDLQ